MYTSSLIFVYKLRFNPVTPTEKTFSDQTPSLSEKHFPEQNFLFITQIFNFKGQCREIFWIIIPQAPENNIRVISIFFF